MSARRSRLILLTRHPVPGRVKTRLIPALGAEGAAALQRRMTCRVLRTALEVEARCGLDLEIRFDGATDAAMSHWLGDDLRYREQGAGDLGERMARAFEDSFREGSAATVLIGADCPGLTADLLATAFDRLTIHPVVLGPATDGGYYLVGLNRAVPEMFQGIAWSTNTVLEDSLRKLEQVGIQPLLLDCLDDIDRPEDLPTWHRISSLEEAGAASLTVIIPALNDAAHIAQAIASARQDAPPEIIVVDGGSADDTPRLASEAGAIVLHTPPGRARQMNAGARRATAHTLLFLHADTRLPGGYALAVANTLNRPNMAAGAFRLHIDGEFEGKALVEWGANLRSRWFQLPYGDQALFLRRARFEELGGFPDLPIMEDYEFVRRLRRLGRVALQGEAVITSGRRWQHLGFLRTTLINQAMILGYLGGVSPVKLAELYRGHEPHQQQRKHQNSNPML